MELIIGLLTGISIGFFLLYTIEYFKNIKLEKERDIETFEKNKLERENKKLKSDEYRKRLIKKIEEKNKRIALLCSKVQSRDKIIAKLRKNENKI